jgi:hypothetical protein
VSLLLLLLLLVFVVVVVVVVWWETAVQLQLAGMLNWVCWRQRLGLKTRDHTTPLTVLLPHLLSFLCPCSSATDARCRPPPSR